MRPILSLNAFDSQHTAGLTGALREQVQRRADAFGAASVLFYDRPLEFVRGEGCWLFDVDGDQYLDAYNNVPAVGHCHPRVAEAAARQLSQLNINTRYLHRGVADYADNLLATFPASLSNVTLTCTGSESNDLALRLAENFTGGRGVIVTEAAYHGNTALVTQVSPSSFKHGAPAPWVRVIRAPDARNAAPGQLHSIFAARVAEAIADLQGCGAGFSALLVDSIFSSDGVHPDPPGFLRAAADVAHRARGLLIADEVQPGFGRTGDTMWGFQRHGVTPDIVTLGKPMGNGYPVAAVITRPEILDGYCRRVGYFNTFGGSPVAAAAGQAVLDVLAEERLMENAARVGAQLKLRLEGLALRHPQLLAVRGAGLYIGVEVESAATTRLILNDMRNRNVLIGAAGCAGSILKIRPPLCFSVAQSEQLIAALDDTLTAMHAPSGQGAA